MLPRRSIFRTGKAGFSARGGSAFGGNLLCPPWRHRPPLCRADFSLPNTTREENSMKFVPATCGQVETCPTVMRWLHRPPWRHLPPLCRADFSLPNTTREERSMNCVPATCGQVPAKGGSASGGKTCPTVMRWFRFVTYINVAKRL